MRSSRLLSLLSRSRSKSRSSSSSSLFLLSRCCCCKCFCCGGTANRTSCSHGIGGVRSSFFLQETAGSRRHYAQQRNERGIPRLTAKSNASDFSLTTNPAAPQSSQLGVLQQQLEEEEEEGKDGRCNSEEPASAFAAAEAFGTMLPLWLTHDPLWFERTLQELNVSVGPSDVATASTTVSSSDSSDSSHTMLHQEYRRLYFDSVESFQLRLLQRLRSLLQTKATLETTTATKLVMPDSVDDQLDGNATIDGNDMALLTAAASAVLDHVVGLVELEEEEGDTVAAGTSTSSSSSLPRFSLSLLSTQKYWQMKTDQTRHHKAMSDLLLKRQELVHRQKRHDDTARQISQLEQELVLLLREQQKQPHDPSDTSQNTKHTKDSDDADDAKGDAEDQYDLSTKEPGSRKRSVQQRQSSALETRIQKLRRTLKGHQHSLEAMTRHVTKLEQQQLETASSQKPPLDPDEFERFHQILYSQVMPIICQAFAAHIRQQHEQMLLQFQTLLATTDLTNPTSWYPRARLDHRRIIFHGGPTNSGKTFAALQRLKEAKRGMYLGPLRLLAVEVYEKLTTEGIYCNLYTGQESREIPFATHAAATMEMASLVDDFDVLVIDEIQMLADQERGYAWTRALIGSRCKEIHVCGGLEARDIVKRIAESCGDDFELRRYERFTELGVSHKSLANKSDEIGSYARNVQEGDCIVAFSRNDIFAIKREIEKNTRHKCCVIYGTLPPQTRSEQARRFNDPYSGHDVLVASDAIGMGLNLNIRRIIFNSMYKHDGSGIARLDHSAVKQISGRAGRRNSPFPIGEVTCRDPRDMPHLARCMSTDIETVRSAGLLPTAGHIDAFYAALVAHGYLSQSQDLHKTLLQFNEVAKLKGDFFLCRQTDMVAIARELAELNLSIREKYTLCMCPVPSERRKAMEVLLRFATKLAAGEVSGVTRSMRPRRARNFDDLSRLCGIYNELEQFLWLQHKFPPGNVMEQQAALACKERTVAFIEEGIANSDKLQLSHCYVAHDKRLRSSWRPPSSEKLGKVAAEYYNDEGDSSSDDEEGDELNRGTPDI